MITILLISAVTIYVTVLIYKKFYFIKVDNTLMFTGAPGTGKTLEMVNMSTKLLKSVRRSVKKQNIKISIHNLIHKDKVALKETPQIYSNIPIRINKNEMSLELKLEHLTLTERVSYKAITVITELGKVVNRYEHKNPNIADNIDEFVSLYRQYTQGGYFLCDDQSSDNAEVDIRRRLGTVINMLHFRRFWFIYWMQMRNITISEDIKTIEDASAEDSMRSKIGFFIGKPKYDTYAFSNRYLSVPYGVNTPWRKLKTNKIMKIPKDRQMPKKVTTND
jgi:hypothetical protein